MVPASATARPILAASFVFLLQLSFSSHHVAAAFSFSFDFSSTSNYSPEDLMFEGDAAVNGGLVDLTCNPAKQNCIGRMSYNHPVFLYDNVTGELASFTTSFTFGIQMVPGKTTEGDGMAFFLSGYPSRLPPASNGNSLGLTNSGKTLPTGNDRFLAVEFDTYGNPFGGNFMFTNHMGIDLNDVNSVKSTRLPNYSLNGTMTATVTFDNATRTLEATLHFDDSPSIADAQVKAQLPDDLNVLLPREVAVGFSASTGSYYELHQIRSWSFNSTMSSKETPVEATKEDPKQDQGISPEGPAPALAPGATNFHPEQGQVLNKKGRRHRRSLIIGGSVVLPSALLLSLASILSWVRRTRARNYFGKGSRLKRYSHRDLSTATDGFSDEKEVGRGEFGVVYKGRLEDKQVAVKRIHKDSRGEFKNFVAELSAIDGTGHVNLVRLEGWCYSLGNFLFSCCRRKMANLFLVYEFVPNGNLHQHLHEKPDVLSWEMRYKIVKGLCSALHYLHHQCRPYILHRDIKPSNILLDNEFNPKLGDFGPSRAAQNNRRTSLQTTRDDVGRTRDYMDPLCKKNGHVKFHRSSDIYSFGLVLLEIAHGENDPEGVRKLHRDQPETLVKAVADKKLAGKFFTKEMERVIVVGLRCSERDENRRPSLIGAMQFLENGGELSPATIHEEDNQRPSLIGAMQSLQNGGQLQDGPRIAPFDLA